jgi:putative PIN family toxin of toxin-antitoxin system
VRVALDTDVIVAALRSPNGASAVILELLDEERATLLLSVPLALEYEAICQLPEHRIVSGLSVEEVRMFVDTLLKMAQRVDLHFRWRPLLPDPGDEMVLETAINGQADLLVTFNQKHYRSVPNTFGIEVVLPRDALERLK